MYINKYYLYNIIKLCPPCFELLANLGCLEKQGKVSLLKKVIFESWVHP